jgi:Tfp pilus assembly protein PilO
VTSRLEGLSPRTLVLAAAGLVLVYALAAWFLFVSPKRSEAARLSDDIAAAEVRLTEAQAAANRPAGAGVPVSEVLQLAKAMPASADHAGLVLELVRLADKSGVSLRSLTPQAVAPGAQGAAMIPVSVTISGSYGKIAKFLHGARTLVSVRDGKLRATGRLLSVQSVDLAESAAKGFPALDATISIHAYVYDGPVVPREEDEEPEEELRPNVGGTAAGRTDS